MKKLKSPRSRTVLFRVTEAEFGRLLKVAGPRSVSDYVRSVVFDLGAVGEQRLLDGLKDLVGRFDRGETA